jgi:DNA-directed RNA polymerase specialized sigma24 family protein
MTTAQANHSDPRSVGQTGPASALSEEKRIVLLMKWYARVPMTFTEIGLCMGIDRTTTASRYRSGMTKILACLERELSGTKESAK